MRTSDEWLTRTWLMLSTAIVLGALSFYMTLRPTDVRQLAEAVLTHFETLLFWLITASAVGAGVLLAMGLGAYGNYRYVRAWDIREALPPLGRRTL